MSAKIIQLSQNGVLKYPRTIDEAIAVVAKSKKLSTVLAELGAEDERLANLIAAAEGKITVLNGTGEGSVDKKIADAIDDFATQVTSNDTIDTVKELFDYVAQHGSDFNALLERVSTAEGKINTLEGQVSTLGSDNTTNKQNIAANTDAINGLNGKVGSSVDEANAEGSLYARIAQLKADLAALSGDGGTVSEQINAAIAANNTSVVTPISNRVAAIETDYLKAADKAELQGKIDEKVAQSDYNTKVAALETSIGNNATAAANAQSAADGAQSTADGAQTAAENAQAKADSAYELADSKIDYSIVGDTTYPDFDEIALS